MWKCERCGREFKRKNQSHFCKEVHTIDEYIALFSKENQTRLTELRETITSAAPEAEGKISRHMPTFVQNGNLVHFAMHKNHIGIYVGASAVETFVAELKAFHCHKGTIRIPHDQPIPHQLIKKLVEYRVKRNKKRVEER